MGLSVASLALLGKPAPPIPIIPPAAIRWRTSSSLSCSGSAGVISACQVSLPSTCKVIQVSFSPEAWATCWSLISAITPEVGACRSALREPIALAISCPLLT